MLPTLLSASNRGYFTVAVSDGLQSPDPARLDDAIRRIAVRTIIKTHTELLDIWGRAASKPPE